MNHYDVIGAAVYACVLVAFFFSTWAGRLLLRLRNMGTAEPVELDAYETARLVGTRQHVVAAALVSLYGQGAIEPRVDERRVLPVGAPHTQAHPFEQAVFRALCSIEGSRLFGSATAPGLTRQVSAALSQIENRLAGLDMTFEAADAERRGRRAVHGFFILAFCGLLYAMFVGSRFSIPWWTFGVMGASLLAAFALAYVQPRLTAQGLATRKALAGDRQAARDRLRSTDRDLAAPAAVRDVALAGIAGLEPGGDPLLETLAAPAIPGERRETVAEATGPYREGLEAPVELGSYGYVIAGIPHASTLDELTRMCRTALTPPVVWTPASPALVHPVEVPALFRIIDERQRRNAKAPLIRSAWSAAFFMAMWGFAGFTVPSFWLVMAFAEALGAVPQLKRWRAARRHTAEELRQPPEPVHLSPWVLRALRKKAHITDAITWALVAVGAVQLIPGFSSVEAAGLVKSAVRGGEWWRLLTAPTLHGNVWHFLGNLMAWSTLGGQVEAFGRRRHLPIVWFLSGLGGSLASMAWLDATSVGASGAIMGCLGYLLVLGWKRRDVLPPTYFRTMVQAVLFTALVGAAGYGVIDNAAHAGGLATGAVLGLLLVPRGTPAAEAVDEPVTAVDWLLMVPFFASCAVSIVAILLGRP